jgi:hypothetical protein
MVDLKVLLEQSAGKGVKIYTHGEMLPRTCIPNSAAIRIWPDIMATPGRSSAMNSSGLAGDRRPRPTAC